MENPGDAAYCGLFCGLCAMKSRIPRTASALRDIMSREGWEFYGEFVLDGFGPFWKALNTVAGYGETCPGCRGGCGNPECGIRKCATERGMALCSECPDHPCVHVQALAQRYPNLLGDARRQREVGVRQWISEQEQRRDTGFCYCDIRIPVDELPSGGGSCAEEPCPSNTD